MWKPFPSRLCEWISHQPPLLSQTIVIQGLVKNVGWFACVCFFPIHADIILPFTKQKQNKSEVWWYYFYWHSVYMRVCVLIHWQIFITVYMHNFRLYKNSVSRVCHCTMYLCIQIDLRREVGGGGQNKKHQAACNNNITVVTFKLLPITVASAVHFFFFYPVPTTYESCPHRLPGQCLHWLPSNQDARPFCQWSVHICCGGEVSLLRIGTIYQWSSLSQSKS